MQTDIPAEQLERIQPRVDQLLANLRRQTENLPPDAESALLYQPESEDAE